MLRVLTPTSGGARSIQRAISLSGDGFRTEYTYVFRDDRVEIIRQVTFEPRRGKAPRAYVCDYSEPYVLVRFPLNDGAKWSADHGGCRQDDPDGYPPTFLPSVFEATSAERVTLPSGESVDAIPIGYVGSRQARSGEVRVEGTRWFAPDLRLHVRHRSSTNLGAGIVASESTSILTALPA